MSPLISASVTHAWACYVLGASESLHSSVSGYGYVDDRTLLLRAGGSFEHLRAAVHRSDAFDRAFSLEVSLPKCAVVAAADSCEARFLAADLGYKHTQVLESLGVCAHFQDKWGLLRFSLRRVTLRLRLLRCVDLGAPQACKLFRSLILPCFTWAAAYASPEAGELVTLRNELRHVFQASAGRDAAAVLLYEVAGWQLEPSFSMGCAALRTFWRAVVSPKSWTELLPISELRGYVLRALPRLSATLQHLGWWLSEDSRTILKRDEVLRCLVDWLRQHYRQLYLRKTGRVWHPARRDEEGLAVGLRLSAPAPDAVYEFAGHRLTFASAGGDRYLALAAFGAGNTNWHLNAGGEFGLAHPRQVFRELREGVPLPVNTAEERLCAREVGYYPPAPVALDLADFREQLSEAILGFASEPSLYVATDGSTCGDDLEDQSPFRAELDAIWMALQATCWGVMSGVARSRPA